MNFYWFRSVDERAGRRDSFSCAWVRYQTRVTRKIASGSGISKPPRWELLYKRRVRGIVNLRMAEVKRKRFAFANWTKPKRGNQVPASFGIMVGVPVVDEGRGFVAAGPVSRILSAGLLRQDGHSSRPNITVRLKRPTRRLWRAEPARAPGGLFSPPRAPSLFGLAPCGVCPARRITATAVRSYRTFSPLPQRCRRGGMFSVALSVNRV